MMKRFVLNTLLFLFPIFFFIAGAEYLLRNIPSTYLLKAEYLNKNVSNIKILCLGNSTAAYGLDPECFSKYAFNAAQASQSLDMDCAILKQNINRFDSLEIIVLAVSYPTLFFKLEESDEKWRLPYYHYYGIETGYEEPRKPLLLQNTMADNLKRIKMYYIDKTDAARKMTPRGMIGMQAEQNPLKLKTTSKEAAERHSVKKLDVSLVEQNVNYIVQIIEMARTKDAKVLLIALPYHDEYKKLLNPKQLDIINNVMLQLTQNEDVYYIDMNKLNFDYCTQDFFDGDHLSGQGARKVSLRIDSIINNL